MTVQDIFVKNMKALLDKKGVSPAQLAEHAPISKAYVYKLLAKERNATIDMIEGIARYFGLDAYQMLMPDFDASRTDIDHLVRMYRLSSDGDRAALIRMAEATAHQDHR